MNKEGLEGLRKDYKENKEEYDQMFKELSNAKYKKCIRKDANGKEHFDYIKMSQMYHSGEW